MAADVRLRWVLDVVDRGAGKKLLVQDRQIRRSLEQTDRVQKRVAASGVGAANRQVASSRRVATARQTESTAAAGAAGSVENYTRAQAHALGLGARIVAQTQRTTAGYNRQAAAAERLTVAERARAAASRTAAGAGAVSAGALGVGAAGAAALGRRARGVALGGGLGLGVALAQTVQFDRAMRNVNSIAQLSERQFGRLSKEVRGLAGPTAQAPRVLAEGLYTLVSSGFDARESMFILGKSARAATAGLTTTEVSTAAVAAVLNSYQLPASRAGLVSDQLFRTVDRGVISFEQLAENVGDVLPFASSLGIGLDQVGASIATLTKAGISAPETMTRIKAVMASLLKPGKDLKTTITELGFESGEALIKQKGFQGALEALARTTGGSKEELAKLFPNIRALGGALALTGRNSRGARKDLEGMRDASGATNRALAQQSKSISFQWNRLKAGASSLAIRIGSKLVPAVSSLVGAMGDLVSGRGDVAGVFKDLAAGVRGRPDTGERGSAPIRRLEVRGAGQQGRAVAVGPRHDVGITAGVRAPEASKAFDIGAKIRDVIGDITDAGRKLIPIVTDAGRQLVDAFKPAQPFLQNILLPLLVGLGKGLLATVVTAFKIAVPVIKVFAIALGAIGKVAAPLRPVLEGVGFALSLLLGGVIVKGIGLVAKFVGNFKIVKVVLAVVLGPLRLLGTAFGSLFRIIGRLPATLGKVGAALSRAGALFGKLPGLLGRVAGGVLNAAGRLATAAGRGLARLPAKLGVTAYRAGRAVVDKLGSWGGKVAGVGSRLLGRIVGGARSVLGDLTGWFGRLGSKVVSAIVGGIKSAGGAVKDAIVSLIPGPLRGALKHIPGIGGFFGRRGGRVKRARRFQRGGLVDAFVSPGEMVVHGASSWMVPGRPTAADSVYAQLPDSAAVLTGDGQRRMMGGASLGSALARQAPHFQRGGIVPGRYTATAYGPPWGGKQGTGTTKTGVDLRKAPKLYGVAVDPRNIPLGKNIYAWPNPFGYGGKFSAFDTGGAIKGRRIDFYDWRGRAEQNAWGRRTVRVSRSQIREGRGELGAGRDVTARAPIMLGRSQIRGGIVEDAFSQALDAARGGAPTGRHRFVDQVRQALSGLETSRNVTVRGANRRAPAGGRGGKAFTSMWRQARSMAGKPYIYGGGHGGLPSNPRGYDCSSAVSAVLHAGGLLGGRTMTTDGFKSYGRSGAGKQVTIGVRGSTGRRAHMMMRLGSRYFEAGRRGVGWRSGWSGSFPIKRHPPGFRRGGLVGRLPEFARDLFNPASPDFLGWGLRRGGIVGRFQRGGTLRGTLGSVERSTAGGIDRFAAVVDDALTGRLERLRRTLLSRIRRGGDAKVVSQLQAALSVIDNELGTRVGRILRQVDLAKAGVERGQGRLDRGLRFAGIDPAASAGIQAQIGFAQTDAIPTAQANVRRLRRAAAAARRGGQRGQARALEEELAAAQDELEEAFVSQVERYRELIRAQAQEAVDIRQIDVESVQGALAGLDISQRLRGTADSPGGMLERARAIQAQLLPALDAQRTALSNQAQALLSIGDLPGARQAMAAVQTAGNEIASALADVAELTRQAALTAAQERVDLATHRLSLASFGQQRLELEQRLAGTFEGGGQARADYINQTVIPALEAERAALERQAVTARTQGDAVLARQVAEAIAGKQNEILQAQLDAQQQIAENTNPLKEFGGGVSFERFGQRFTDDLTSLPVGA